MLDAGVVVKPGPNAKKIRASGVADINGITSQYRSDRITPSVQTTMDYNLTASTGSPLLKVPHAVACPGALTSSAQSAFCGQKTC